MQMKVKGIGRVNLGYLFIFPALFFMVALRIYPLIRGLYISFFKTDLIRNWDFVGLKNYIKVLSGSQFYSSIFTTIKFTIFVVAGHFIIGFILSHILNKKIKGITFFRAVLILPWVIPESIIAMIFKWILNPLYGLVNHYLLQFSLISEPLSWLGSGDTAFAAVVMACIWKGFPMIMVILLAGLQNISLDLYEASDIDGASEWQKFIYITIPSLKGVLYTALVLDTIWWFKHYTIVWVLTQGGPGSATALISIDIFKRSFEYFDFGGGSAVAIIVFAIIFGMKYLMERIFKLNVEE